MKKGLLVGGISTVAVLFIALGTFFIMNGGSEKVNVTSGTKALEYAMNRVLDDDNSFSFLPFDGATFTDESMIYVTTDTTIGDNYIKGDLAFKLDNSEIYFNGNMSSSNNSLENTLLYLTDENVYVKKDGSVLVRIPTEDYIENIGEGPIKNLKNIFRSLIMVIRMLNNAPSERLGDLFNESIEETVKESLFNESKVDIELGEKVYSTTKWELDINEKLVYEILYNFIGKIQKDDEALNDIENIYDELVDIFGMFDYDFDDVDVKELIKNFDTSKPVEASNESFGTLVFYGSGGDLVRTELNIKNDGQFVGIALNHYENSKKYDNYEVVLLSGTMEVMKIKLVGTGYNKYDYDVTAVGQKLLSGTLVNTNKQFKLTAKYSQDGNGFNIEYTREVVKDNKEEKVTIKGTFEEDGEQEVLDSKSTIYVDKKVDQKQFEKSKLYTDLTEKEKEDFANF